MSLTYTVVLMPEADGGYSVFCPALPGCASQGETLEETLENIQEAALGWLEVWLEEGNPLPVETPATVADEVRQTLLELAKDGLPLVLETREIALPQPVPV